MTLQVALVHFLFNITGIALWYPIPLTRIPIRLAKGLGNVTASYRWFAAVYILGCFFMLPLFIFSLSLAGWPVLTAVVVPLLALLIAVIMINMAQQRKPECLPPALRSWDFLPLWVHSLEPWDKVVDALTVKCCRCCKSCDAAPGNTGNQPMERNSGECITVYENPKKEMEQDMKIELNILKMTRL